MAEYVILPPGALPYGAHPTGDGGYTTVFGTGPISGGGLGGNSGAVSQSVGISGLVGNRPKDEYIDGNYNTPQPTGLPVVEYPFLHEGDTTTMAVRQPMEQFAATYTSPDPRSVLPMVPNAYLTGDRSVRDVGNGVYAFERCAAQIPRTRTVRGESYRYAFQIISFLYNDGAYSFSSESFPRNVDCTLVYDYFLDGNQASFPLYEAPQIIISGGNLLALGKSYTNGTFPLYLNGAGQVCSRDAYILVEDDEYGIYTGAILYRRRRLIAGPTTAFWGDTLRLPN